MGGLKGAPLDRGQVQLTTSVETANREDWQRGTEEVDGPDAKASSVLWATELRLGLGHSLEGGVAIPVAWMDAEDPDGSVSRSSVGDLLTSLTWAPPFATNAENWSGALIAGAYWPVGELGAEGLPATATFSTGTVDPTLGFRMAGPRLGTLGWQLSSTARVILGEQDNGRQLGSSFTTTLGLDHALGSRLTGQFLLTHFHREEDSGPVMEDTGGTWLYAEPLLVARLHVQADRALQVLLGARVPLVQDVNGRQLVESPSVRFGLAYTLGI